MRKAEIKSQIEKILISNLKVDKQLAEKNNLSLVKDLALDSLQILNFILLIEEKFSICIDADEIEGYKFGSIPYITDYIYKVLSGKE